jgi:hypothetical protein
MLQIVGAVTTYLVILLQFQKLYETEVHAVTATI